MRPTTMAEWARWLLAFSLLLVSLDVLLNVMGFTGILATVAAGLIAFVFADSVAKAIKWMWLRLHSPAPARAEERD